MAWSPCTLAFLLSVGLMPTAGLLQVRDHDTSLTLCVVATKPVLPEFIVMLRSLRAAVPSNSSVVFNILTVDADQDLLKTEVERLNFRADIRSINFKRLEEFLDKAQVAQNHHSGLVGFSKIFFFEAFEHVHQCVILDTDIYIGEDPSKLLASFDTTKVMAATWQPDVPFGSRFNAGVMVQNFDRMRAKGPAGMSFSDALMQSRTTAIKFGVGPFGVAKDGEPYRTHWPEQELLHLALIAYAGDNSTRGIPSGLQPIDYSWNLEQCAKFHGLCQGNQNVTFKIAHFNCVRKQKFWWDRMSPLLLNSTCVKTRTNIDLSLLRGVS